MKLMGRKLLSVLFSDEHPTTKTVLGNAQAVEAVEDAHRCCLHCLTCFLGLLFPETLNLTRTGFKDLVVRSLFSF